MRRYTLLAVIIVAGFAALALWTYNRLNRTAAIAQILIVPKANAQSPSSMPSSGAPDFESTQPSILHGRLLTEKVAAHPRIARLALASDVQKTTDLIRDSLLVLRDPRTATNNGLITLAIQRIDPDAAVEILEVLIEEYEKLCESIETSGGQSGAEVDRRVSVRVVTPPGPRR